MYALEQLQQKSLKQLKEIGWQLNVMPEGDKRCRQNWIDALVVINPPLLQLLEVSPAASVEQAQETIALAAETSPGVKVERTIDYLDCPSCGAVHGLYATEEYSRWDARCIHCDYVKRSVHHPFEYTWPFELPLDRLNFLPIVAAVETSPVVDFDQAHPAIAEATENSPGVERALESIENLPSINLAAKNFSGSRAKASIAHQLLELFKSSAHIIEDSPGVKTEATVSESASGPAAKNPILTGVTFSDRFLARYSPPQSGIIYFQSELDGQLSLLDFEVQSEPEPPDPDDFESLDAFREAITRWDAENPELLAASIDSMCEWAPCPEEWYWPKAEILPLKASSTIDQSLPSEQYSVIELSIAGESFVTCNFFIPTFDAWCDRFNRSDELPDTVIYARLPKPKPSSFPPTAVSQARVKRGLNAYQTQSKRILNAAYLHTIYLAAGNNSQPGRSPPGGDASF